nr:TraB/GumN family protein [uncultured Sphingomonas sp.]
MFLKKFVPILGPAALLSSPALAQAEVAPPKPDLDPAVWVVKDPDTTIYLFGTVHILDGKGDWFNDEVKASFDKASELVLEVILPEDKAKLAPLVLKYGLDMSGKKLSDKLSPQGKVRLASAAKEAGIPIEAMDHFKPFFASISLSALKYQKMGMNPESGAEKTLTAAATAAGKKLGELETVEFQMSRFDALPEDEQIRLLEKTLEDDEDAEAQISAMVDAWGKGDPERLGKIIAKMDDDSEALTKMLLVDRNKSWSDWIANRLKQPGTIFVAVGAAHLAGKDSVQNMLKAQGIDAERVPNK